jgi:hypothetical protein
LLHLHSGSANKLGTHSQVGGTWTEDSLNLYPKKNKILLVFCPLPFGGGFLLYTTNYYATIREKGVAMRTRAVTNGQVASMELTKDQAYVFLRKELITGLEDGELSEEEFVIQMKDVTTSS